MDRIDRFAGLFRFLSNFYPALVVLDGVVYPSVEHAYQAAKSTNGAVREHIRIAPTPAVAKRYGREVLLRPDWESVKIQYMKHLVWQKFSTHELLGTLLLATGDAELVEGNTWNDRFWGVCRGVGENWLGRILMDVRVVLRST
jgi:ribA/ribD-fused uncharacterized protein